MVSASREQDPIASAEMAVLGGLLLSPERMEFVLSGLESFGDEAFLVAQHRQIWRAYRAVHKEGRAIDPVTVNAALATLGWEPKGSALGFLAELSSKVPMSKNIPHYLAMVIEAAAAREATAIGRVLVGTSEPGLAPVVKARDGLDKLLSKATPRRISASRPSEDEEWFMAELEQVVAGDARLRDIDTGLESIDRITDGLGRGDLTIIAARPSVGKTAMACNIAVANALAGKKVLLYSFEMSKKQILLRLCSIAGHADPRQLHGPSGKACLDKLREGMALLSGTQLQIAEQLKPTIEGVEQSLSDYAAANGSPDVIIVDYLQLIRSSRRYDNRNLEIGAITGTLKELARTYNAQMIALSQLRRSESKRPGLDELRDSGSIEQDADVVFLLSYSSHKSRSEIILNVDVAKNRPGATGSTQVGFFMPFQQMRMLEPELPKEEPKPKAAPRDPVYLWNRERED